MAEDRSQELDQRRGELTRSLDALSERRASTYRLNSDALALDRAGVKRQSPQEMEQLKADESAAHDAYREVQRELRNIDTELASAPARGLRSRFGRARSNV